MSWVFLYCTGHRQYTILLHAWLISPVLISGNNWEYFRSPLDGMLMYHRASRSIKFAGTHLYTWVERSALWKWSALPKNTTQHLKPGLKPRLLDLETGLLIMTPLHFPILSSRVRVNKLMKEWIVNLYLLYMYLQGGNPLTKHFKHNPKKPYSNLQISHL